jgi:hypothetical protein
MKVTIECDCGDTIEEGGRYSDGAIWFRCYNCNIVTVDETWVDYPADEEVE